jgi:flavin reductase (DIM6/NTAB) family NADH-FMN oxidoreductase RutF
MADSSENLVRGWEEKVRHSAKLRAAMPIDDAAFKLAMSHFPSGVTVVTTEHDGRQYGMTVASFASLSLRPPLVLVCIEKTVKTHDAILAAGKFGVSILGANQADISSRFASRMEDKFAGLESKRGTIGVPLIAGALTMLECRVKDQLPGGDHTIFVGEVVEAYSGEGAPLLYFRSGYHEMRS